MKRFLAILLCGVLLFALPAAAEEEPLVSLARQELTALGYDPADWEVSFDPGLGKTVFTREGERIAFWGRTEEEESRLLAFFLQDREGETAGLRPVLLTPYYGDSTHWVILRTQGDADGDGKITTTDARLILQATVLKSFSFDYWAMPTGEDPEAAEALGFLDVDGSGLITTTDARLILQKAVDKIDKFPKNH